MAQRFLPTLVAAAALVLAGCGGSSPHKATSATTGSSATTHSTTAPTTFLGRLDSACTRANNAFAGVLTPNAQVAVVAHYLEIFHSLPAPARLQSVYARYLAVLDQELIDLKQGDSAGLFRLARTKARPLARQLGATGCITSS
jgi:hypothetical protein